MPLESSTLIRRYIHMFLPPGLAMMRIAVRMARGACFQLDRLKRYHGPSLGPTWMQMQSPVKWTVHKASRPPNELVPPCYLTIDHMHVRITNQCEHCSSFFPFFLKLVAKGDLELGYLDNRNNLRGMRKNRLPVLKEVGHVEDRG